MIERSMDELMWFIAEEGDHSAVEGFIKRYPEHRAEMIKRVNLVREVRHARPEQPEGTKTAHFQPRPEVRKLANPKPKPIVFLGAAAVLASMAWAGYAALNPKRFPVAPPAVVSSSQPAPVPDPRQDPGYDPNQNVVPHVDPPAPPIAAYDKPVTIEQETTTLIALLNDISRQTGLRIEMGPGMPNPQVAGMYAGMRAIDVLKDLGRKHGFTVFDQESDHILLIPAVDVSRSRWTDPDLPAAERDPANPANSANPANPAREGSLPRVSDTTN